MPRSVCRQTTRTEALTLLSNILKFVGGRIYTINIRTKSNIAIDR